MSDNSYIAPIQVDSDGDLILVFPDELLAAMDWNEGDTLIWTQTLQSLMSPATINEQKFILPLNHEDYQFLLHNLQQN